MIAYYLILGMLTIAISVLFGFMPWGLIASIAFPIGMILVAALLPRKRYIRMNMNMAIEGLSYGRLNDAKEHMISAIEYAESESKVDHSEIEALKLACKGVADALSNIGETETARTLLDRCNNLLSKHSPNQRDA